jgi:hypothetical protein
MKNKKKVFEDFVKEKEFDPLLPQNWYHFENEIKHHEVCYFVNF